MTTTTKVENGELEFSNLNPVGETLNYIQALSPRELQETIQKIRMPLKIVSIYNYGSLHIAWILTRAKIKKVKGK